MVVSITEEFTSIAASFGALIEGLSYIDEDVATKIAVEFSDKLVKSTRAVYAEMASKVATELAKPSKRKPRRKRVATTVIQAGQQREIPEVEIEAHTQEEDFGPMGTDPLPENPRSFMTSGPISMGELDGGFAERLMGGVVERGPSAPTSSHRQPKPPGGDEGRAIHEQRRMSTDEADEIPESDRR